MPRYVVSPCARKHELRPRSRVLNDRFQREDAGGILSGSPNSSVLPWLASISQHFGTQDNLGFLSVFRYYADQASTTLGCNCLEAAS